MTNAYIAAHAAIVCSQVWMVNADSNSDSVIAAIWLIWAAILFLVDNHVSKD